VIDSHAARPASYRPTRTNLGVAVLLSVIAVLAIACGPGGSTAAPGGATAAPGASSGGTPQTQAPAAPGY
jgi:hypothetical protein